MDRLLRRNGGGTASEVEFGLWVRGLRRRWFAHMAGRLARHLAGAITRDRLRLLPGLLIARLAPRG